MKTRLRGSLAVLLMTLPVFAAMSTSGAAQTSVATNATNGATITRYVGVSIAPTNGASLIGAD